MPRPKKEGAPEPKRRSRTGCWPCKARKVKCGEEKPRCLNCERQGEPCDYSIRLNWGGRTKTKGDGFVMENPGGGPEVPGIVFPSPEAFTGQPSPSPTRPTFASQPQHLSTSQGPRRHARTHSNLSLPPLEPPSIDPVLANLGYTDRARSTSMGPKDDLPSPFHHRQVASVANENMHLPSRPGSGYSSPTASNFGSPSYNPNLTVPNNLYGGSAMPPPYRSMHIPVTSPNRTTTFNDDAGLAVQHRSKRVKIESEPSSFAASSLVYEVPLDMPTPVHSVADLSRSPHGPLLHPHSPFNSVPLTPGSSVASDENPQRTAARSTPISNQPPPDLRRLSVSSLLADTPVEPYQHKRSSISEEKFPTKQYPVVSAMERLTTYGFDCGQPDLDTPRNDDTNAIMIFSPPASKEAAMYGNRTTPEGYFSPDEPGYNSRARDMAFEPGGYYASPVPIKIPQSFEPLPPALLENKMNLLYFHHFLNHTARILVPHDCEQNPFRVILPEMALQDPDMLNMVLAYSASHRSRLLHHREPVNRIASYVKEVIPKLRQALVGSEPISLKSFGTAVMFASLEVLSPSEVVNNIPWRSHLQIARQMLVARGGPQAVHKDDKFSYFLNRWFAYLDVLGSYSGIKSDSPLCTSYWATDPSDNDPEGEFKIDCLIGFSGHCVGILARISQLVKECEGGRIDENGDVRREWVPPPEVQRKAEELKLELRRGREHTYKPCPHRTRADDENEAGWDSSEILTTNEMYHWAGLIHLTRRVLNRPSTDPEVQTAVREIIDGLYKIRHGSTAEACLLFPMFTAGCSAVAQGQRDKIMSRLRSVENFGMTQVSKARLLMQRVWDTVKPWESLVTDEFFG